MTGSVSSASTDRRPRGEAVPSAACVSCGLNSSAHSAGLRVSETKQEMTVDAEIVTANWRKNCPEMPLMNADGMNTAHSVSAIASSAPPTSSMVRCAASRGDSPSRRLRSTFSTTTIASSTTMPTASTSPNSDRLFSENPSAARIAKVPTSDTGIAMIGMIDARQVCRNRITTTTTSATASTMVTTTSCTDCAMNSVVS